MSTSEFSNIGHSSAAWICPSCSRPNNSSLIYSVPGEDADDTSKTDSVPINLSTHPSMLDSISDISMPSRSSTSTEPYSDTSFASADQSHVFTSSPKTAPRTHTKKSLRVLNVNFRSLRKKGKLLEAIILDTDPDIIIGTETWLDKDIHPSEILPNGLGYNIQRRDRPESPHGGVLIAVKKALQFSDIYCSQDVELISGTVKMNSKSSITVVAYYRPPDKTDKAYLTKTREEIARLREKSKRNIFLLGGDFNLPDIKWATLQVEGSQNPFRVNKSFFDMTADNSLEQIVSFPTRKDKLASLKRNQ